MPFDRTAAVVRGLEASHALPWQEVNRDQTSSGPRIAFERIAVDEVVTRHSVVLPHQSAQRERATSEHRLPPSRVETTSVKSTPDKGCEEFRYSAQRNYDDHASRHPRLSG